MQTELQIDILRRDDIPIVHLSGDLDSFTCSKLKQALLDLINQDDSRVVIDMKKVNYVDSSGLGTLIGGLSRAAERNGTIAVSNANPQLQKVLRITGLDKVLSVFVDEAEAVRNLGSWKALSQG